MTDPQTLDDMWHMADVALSTGVTDRNHPARHPVLATLGADGPEQRVLVLRGWDNGAICLQTDAATTKVRELTSDPRCALHVWVPEQFLQLRLSARASLTPGTADAWAKMPETARGVYGGAPTPATPMQSADDYTPGAELARFMVLTLACHRIEVLHLGAARHCRALFQRDTDHWDGTWIAP